MLVVTYANKLMEDAKKDDENSEKDLMSIIKEYLLIFILLLIIDIVLIVYAYRALKKCKDFGIIPDWIFWSIFVVILSPILSVFIPMLAVLAPFSFITSIIIIIYSNMKCGNKISSPSPLSFAMWKKNRYNLAMNNTQSYPQSDIPSFEMHDSKKPLSFDEWY
jgi:hypothetical protein